MKKTNAEFDAFDFGYETIKNIPKMTVLGYTKAYVENFESLLEYKDDNIKLKSKIGVMEICGTDFKINNIREGSIEIFGKISGIKLI